MRPLVRAGALMMIGLAALGCEVPFPPTGAARAESAPQQMGGTWDLTWKTRRGATRTGIMEVQQRGSQLVAQVYDRGGASATGSISGSAFILRGSRLALPFTVTGRIRHGRMTGLLTALGVERRFTGTRRRARR